MDNEEQKRNFEVVIEQHKGILFKIARAYCADNQDRQDLLQEMMIQIWQSLHKYNRHYNISTWVYRIALNVAISFYRKSSASARRYSEPDEQIPESLPDDTLEYETQLNLLEQFISELKEMDKALMILYLEDKSHAEIADILGISVSNVGTKIGRIKDKLKMRFSQFKSL